MLGLPGVGEARAAAYAAAGLRTRRDLLHHLPVRYRRRRAAVTVAHLQHGEPGAVTGTVQRTSVRRRGRRSTASVLVRDEAGDEVVVLLFNRGYLARSLPRGTRLWVAGRVQKEAGERPRLLATDYERLAPGAPGPGERRAARGGGGEEEEEVEEEATGDEEAGGPGGLLPIYRLPKGIPPRVHRKVLAALLETPPDDWRPPLPGEPSLAQALAAVHRPASEDEAQAGRARLARDEALALSFLVAARRAVQGARPAVALPLNDRLHARLLAALPYAPTAAQARAIAQIRADLRQGRRPMARLLQGDVGSGKTLVACYALLAALAAGRQAALMAPTEILAAQHAGTLEALLARAFGEERPRLVRVLGSQRPAERRAAREALASGAARVAVGTHGLQSPSMLFHDLAVAVVDEQHRFGVRQRVRFRTKGEDCHLLVMTATPIPRTLALTAYGELDVSVIDELPPGRAPRRTVFVPPARQPALWRHLAACVAAGERGYVVCPSIEGGGDGEQEAASVVAVAERAAAALGPAVRVGSVHGRMPPEQRDRALAAFRGGGLDVLVATVIVEVGLDVEEATFVVVPDPSRFGLATLHQIRGRVGRGRVPGACYLLGPVAAGPARRRVRALLQSDDGFRLAEEDLQLRGPGELLGTRQSGFPGFCVLDPVADVGLLAEAREAAFALAEGASPAALEALAERAFPATRLVTENLLAGG